MSYRLVLGYCCYFHSCFCVQSFEFWPVISSLITKRGRLLGVHFDVENGKNKHGNGKVFTLCFYLLKKRS